MDLLWVMCLDWRRFSSYILYFIYSLLNRRVAHFLGSSSEMLAGYPHHNFMLVVGRSWLQTTFACESSQRTRSGIDPEVAAAMLN